MKRSLLSMPIVILLCGQLLATVPTKINYQGHLTTAAGTPVPDGDYVIFFSIYDVPSGGAAIWTEVQFVTSTDGLISVLLGSTTPLTDTVFNNTTRYLGVRIGADPELSPRRVVATVPYAHRVATVDGASGGEISGMVTIDGVEEGLRLQGAVAGPANSTWLSFRDGAGTALGYVGDGSGSDQDMYLTSYVGKVHIYTAVGPVLAATATGAVGIGTTTPSLSSRLHVLGEISVPPSMGRRRLQTRQHYTGRPRLLQVSDYSGRPPEQTRSEFGDFRMLVWPAIFPVMLEWVAR